MIIFVPNHTSCAIGGGALTDICIVLSPPLVVRTHSYRNFTNIIFVTIILHRHNNYHYLINISRVVIKMCPFKFVQTKILQFHFFCENLAHSTTSGQRVISAEVD